MPKKLIIQFNPVKYIISGGGTGGHIYPAIAVAQALQSIDSLAEILFVGAKGRMEMQKVPQAGYPIEGLWISGIERKLSLKMFGFPFKLVSSLWRAYRILQKFKPDVVVGFGGYASGAVLYVAQKLGLPTIIQEQNSYAGLTNQWLAKKAQAICVAYPNMEAFFPKEKTLLTGNPIRQDILHLAEKKTEAYEYFDLSPNKKTLFIMGGSLGARSINETLQNQLTQLLSQDIQVLWQTGKLFWSQNQAFIAHNQSPMVKIVEFINRMDLAYSIADVVISRAGALSISELCLAGKPTIFVPFPFAAEDHQTKNVQALLSKQAAILVPDNQVRTQLIRKVIQLIKDDALQQKLSENIHSFAKPNATNEIAQIIWQIAKKSK
ncbi:MAG: undecaprenyldiphospho-muramoylpentapeptide beta-N-acetylglucosaminyltransferase [Microscillaceae bacterium]|nr:undecaprenyldiphospho-muramoylpentapeptide beta-N-acetylglucosaminyltransferase [Microscillaceae bacterium]MDW8460548.1 undecaprenyldiphospho-muramoylpentapeptide beta-N-acetylglucosaminyltransferase [Cytophagales bacterium]